MNAVILQVLTILVSAGDVPPENPAPKGESLAPPAASRRSSNAPPENVVLKELVGKGVVMPDGQVIALPAPIMAEGMSVEQQATVLAKEAPGGKVEQFLEKLSAAPIAMKFGKIPAKQGSDVIRTINVSFVVYGDWNVLTSDKFSNGILKKDEGNDKNQSNTVKRAGYLKAPEMAVRRLSARSAADIREYFLYTTLNLFDRVEVSATRFGMATKTPTGVVVAALCDSRFAKDAEFPNRWQSITKDAQGDPELGPAQPYSGAGFYAKVTRLARPQNAIFVEYHSVFYEPREWFGEDEKLLSSKLRSVIPFKVKDFRIKLLKATAEQGQAADP